MISISSYCKFLGKNFYPSKLEESLGLRFDKKNNPNEIVKVQKREYGISILEDKNLDYPSLEYLNIISNIKKHSLEFGITEIVLYINVEYEGQCNLELNTTLLKKLADLDIVVALTTYEKE